MKNAKAIIQKHSKAPKLSNIGQTETLQKSANQVVQQTTLHTKPKHGIQNKTMHHKQGAKLSYKVTKENRRQTV